MTQLSEETARELINALKSVGGGATTYYFPGLGVPKGKEGGEVWVREDGHFTNMTGRVDPATANVVVTQLGEATREELVNYSRLKVMFLQDVTGHKVTGTTATLDRK